MKTIYQKETSSIPINYNVNIFLMLFGRLVSGLGTSIFNFALGLYILDLTGSASKFSLTLAASLLPGFFVNLFGGVFVDRYNKKVMIVAADLLSGVFVFPYMLLFSHFSRNIMLFILYPVILNVLQSFFSLTLSSAIPNIASEDKVAKANSGSQAIWSMMGVIGPIIGALVYKNFGMYLIFTVYGSMLILAGLSELFLRFNKANEKVTAVSDAISDITNTKSMIADNMEPEVSGLVEPEVSGLVEAGVADFIETEVTDLVGTSVSAEEAAAATTILTSAVCEEEHITVKGYFGGIMEAVTYIFNQKILAFLFVFSSVMNMIYYPLMSMVIPFINYHVLKVSGLQLSVVQSAGAIGVVLGAVLISVFKSSNGFLKKFFVLFMLQGILILLWAFPRLPYFVGGSRWTVTIGFAVLLVMSAMINIFQTVPMVTYFQVKVPEQLRGRVLGVFCTTFGISAPLGLWIFGIAMGGLDWVSVTVFSGVLILMLGAIFSRNKVFRNFVKNL